MANTNYSVAKILNAGVMTGTATLTSDVVDLEGTLPASLEITWTSTAVGTLTVEVSNTGDTWVALTLDPALVSPAGTAGTVFVSLADYRFKKLRVKYVNSSSTGVLNVWVCGERV